MEWLHIVIGIFFLVFGLACLFGTVIGLPGTWILLGLALVIEWADRWYLPDGGGQTFNGWLLLACFLIACVGEVLEFFAGVLGAKRGGSTKRGMTGALIGGFLGGFMGFLIPVPLFGALIGAFLGTFAGAIIGEISAENQTVSRSMKPALGATVGRILGTLAKLPIAFSVWLALSIAVFVH